MKRRWFFFLEQLKITPAERKTVMTLLGMLVVLALLNSTLSSPIPYGEEDYAELEEQFRQQSEKFQAREAQLMQRYFPENTEKSAAVADTLPSDTTRQKEAPLLKSTVDEQAEDARININSASLEALITLPGIGPVYARRIIEYRTIYNSFKDVEELKNIRGIGEKRLDKLKPFIKLTDSE